ncbi:SDR family oxidoreductase [Pseudomonas sp. HR96]|uniref:SDR family NAD(P)-dependent oxidoreductase n=1 Tax=Pseudomonas sp. HR96 TaxID=1027966 RepID=UPI002A7619AE|nr:SDR family oxidoreductase [Pseudomonas sp. HR96]WPP01289.1 SDR family oxidoreductase [Pseudomonas sp. HR96]
MPAVLENFSLSGKTILVTGASSGIGRQIALSCAEAGASLVISGRDSARLHQVLEELVPGEHRALLADLNQDAELEALVQEAGKIDGIVHCAGFAALAPVRLISRAHIESQLGTNLVGPLLLTRQLLLRNLIREGGSILFISSISAHIGVHGVAAYSASKGAVEAMTRVLAMEVAKKKIRANCLAPGLVQTPLLEAAKSTAGGLDHTLAQYPLGVGQPEDVANAAVFFLSPASRWITGTTLVMDGGHTVG